MVKFFFDGDSFVEDKGGIFLADDHSFLEDDTILNEIYVKVIDEKGIYYYLHTIKYNSKPIELLKQLINENEKYFTKKLKLVKIYF